MLPILVWSVIFIISLIVLVKSADLFTSSAEKIGVRLGISAFIVGVTIVAVGTSLPELVTSLFAVFKGSTEIVASNVVGSNITNIFLVLGVAAILSRKKIKTSFGLIHVDLPFLIGSAFLFAITIIDGVFTFWEGIICLFTAVIYFIYTIKVSTKSTEKKIAKEVKSVVKLEKSRIIPWIILLIGAVLIYFSAGYLVESIIQLSTILDIGIGVITITAVALGTSLPELAVSVSAIRKGNMGMAVGNVLGSCIFNVLVVMGIPALFSRLTVPAEVIFFAMPMMLMATVLYFFIVQDDEITKWEGWLLVIFYVFFLGKMFNLF